METQRTVLYESSASSFGSDITHNVAAGSALKSPSAGALRSPQLASHFQTIKCRAGFHHSTLGSGQYFHSLSPICLHCCTKISQFRSSSDVIVQSVLKL